MNLILKDILILPQTAIIKWSGKNKKYYESKGYKYTKMFDLFEVNVLDLSPGSNYMVKCKCNYCNKEIIRPFKIITKSTLLLACYKCNGKNMIITNRQKYGVNSTSQIKEVRDKQKQTNLRKYGVEYVLQNEEIKDKMIKKALKSKYQNGTSVSSKQQRYLHKLLGGELCYPVDRLALDIAFLDEMLYIEYNGSGHDACTKKGCSKEDFERREFKRKQFLQNKGWKIIRIISIKDLLPQDEEIIYLIEQCKNYLLNSNHSWIDINIDNGEINCAEYTKIIKFNNLRKII